MGLKLQIDSLDDVGELVRPLYVEKDGKFVLPVEGIEDTAGLKSALGKERSAREALEKQKKSWERLGKTPDEIAEMLEAMEGKALTESERKGEWEKLKTQMNDKHQQELRGKDETIGQMRKRLERELVDAKAAAAIAEAKGVPKLLLPIVKDHVKVDENFNVVVVDGKGDPRVDAKGDPMTISALISEMKSSEDYGRAFEGSGQSGSGMPPSNGATGGTGAGRITKAALNSGTPAQARKARVNFISLYGEEAYFALPAK